MKLENLHQVIYVDLTKFGQMTNDQLNVVVNCSLACQGESSLEPRTAFLFLLPLQASNDYGASGAWRASGSACFRN